VTERRPITDVDRMLAHDDKITRAIGETVKARRRTHLRFGQLTVVVVEQTDEPTQLYLTNGAEDAQIVEATSTELTDAATAVRKLLSRPPPIKRRRL
jgi:hypothetical protein